MNAIHFELCPYPRHMPLPYPRRVFTIRVCWQLFDREPQILFGWGDPSPLPHSHVAFHPIPFHPPLIRPSIPSLPIRSRFWLECLEIVRVCLGNVFWGKVALRPPGGVRVGECFFQK